ncbi:TPA: hypothetical protein N2D10_003231 [Clostridium botulinum]|nr:hypothetical protein [Clostridium botulinum]
MKNYVVGINNIYDNELKLVKIKAKNKKEAIILAVGDNIEIFKDLESTEIDDLKQYYFNGDILVSEPLEVKEF